VVTKIINFATNFAIFVDKNKKLMYNLVVPQRSFRDRRRDTKMSTAMVIATVITTDVDVEKVKSFTLEQIRDNDQGLLNHLLDRGVDARVATAILNVEEFLDYLRIRRRNGAPQTRVEPAEAPSETVVVTDNMSELEFMEYTLQQLTNGEHEPVVKLNEEALEAMEDERIGEEFSRRPFLY
jgi:hypothetical protein